MRPTFALAVVCVSEYEVLGGTLNTAEVEVDTAIECDRGHMIPISYT